MSYDLSAMNSLLSLDGIRLVRTNQSMNDSVESFHDGKTIMSYCKFDIFALTCKDIDDKPEIGEHVFSIREEISKSFSIQVGIQCKCFVVLANTAKALMVINKPPTTISKYSEAFDANGIKIGRVKKAISVRDRKLILKDGKTRLFQIKAKRKVLLYGDMKFKVYHLDDTDRAGLFRKYQKKNGEVDMEIIFPKTASLQARALFITAAVLAEVHWFQLDDNPVKLTTIKITG